MADIDLLEELVGLIGEVADTGRGKVGPEARFGTDIPVSSSEMLRILSKVKSRFGVEFGPAEILGVRKVGDLVSLVERRLGA